MNLIDVDYSLMYLNMPNVFNVVINYDFNSILSIELTGERFIARTIIKT